MFKKVIYLSLSISILQIGISEAQQLPIDQQYRATPTKINDLVHTKLDVRFDYTNQFLNGKEWVTLQPYFYPTDSLRLDAKGMDIKQVSLVNGTQMIPLKYTYDDHSLLIKLDRNYLAKEQYTVYIDYTAKPNLLKAQGSAAINDAKGLYFINPDERTPNKPRQIWTQGETEASSAWFPTIDRPNQKTTAEISMTVLDNYVSLSNGALSNQQKNSDGTRTDTWKMDLPHAPYLFMMAVGDFKIYQDKYNNIPVDYYLEPKYAPYAKDIFGKTPAMMDFYSKTLGVPYPWNKYAQIVCRDYVSGAMENTSATLHGEHVQKTKRELLDDNQEGTIAHELFHQWFGDLVTAESWSNLTMNESFATFGEVIWREHDGGKDRGDKSRFEKLQSYLKSTKNGKSPTLARYYYHDKEDMFDNISYAKGSLILYALKEQMGDEAFYQSLKKYLTDNSFKTGEPQQLRLAMEEVTGKDWAPYFNQWYYQGGHPILRITTRNGENSIILNVAQIQDSTVQTFQLPLAVDIYTKNGKIRQTFQLNKRNAQFMIPLPAAVEFIDIDPEKTLVGQIQIDKSDADYLYQYEHAPSFANRVGAIAYASKNPTNTISQQILTKALADTDADLAATAIQGLDLSNPTVRKSTEKTILTLAEKSEASVIRASAIQKLAQTKDKKYKSLILNAVNDKSYMVIASSIMAIKSAYPDQLQQSLKRIDPDATEYLKALITELSKS
ncbi:MULTISPECIES: M1 family aminopeptidase [Sphingobacterium]|uniref:Aminopeptidase N n=2 Tax=Sphingobacterium multivorum TaxID=28454 RepID=A0A654BUJ8_SPHMU|nr:MULTISPECIES: M1 family aminopeptidase [Sphingobacterium]HBI88433.1 peptidase M1 [Sphingobacterium sp.]QQT44029.1 M1 family peptidase [Sphingobacterium multivorum]QQT63219.1 M1 family peptidase [Sphingobacterium multivorum]SUJ08876.1 Aminopeptidase N [Sphingobacterium multivorum]VXC84429.1 Peptidase M1 [Sphingobacterium multivorum]